MPVGSGKKKAGGQKKKQNATAKAKKDVVRAAGKDQALRDKTFGLKNKKGAKGQAFVQTTTRQLKGDEIAHKKRKEAEHKKKKADKKEAEKEALRLFSLTSTARGKDGKKLSRNQVAAEKKKKEEKERLKKEKEEAWGQLTLEEKIEHKRKQLDTTKCTPVTPENFAIWKAAKRAKKAAAEEAMGEAMKKKFKSKKNKGGDQKISGRQLFAMDASLFKDDAAAVGDDDILGMSEPEDSADEEEEEDRGLLDSDTDMDSSDDEDGDAPKKAKPTKAAAPPAAPAADDGVAEIEGVTADLYLNDDGLDGLDDLDDLEDSDEEE